MQALIFLIRENLKAALPFFERAAAAEPDYYEAQLYAGRTYLNMKDYGKAYRPFAGHTAYHPMILSRRRSTSSSMHSWARHLQNWEKAISKVP